MQQNQNPNKVAATEAPRRVISLLVDNHNGVLARVSSLFCRRGFNIDSLTVSATNDPAVSRITVTLHGDDAAISQLILQTERLEVTRQVFELTPDKSLQRELLLLKVACNTAERAEMREIAAIYKSKIIDLSPDSMVFELTGRPEKINAFLKMFSGYDILELCRTAASIPTCKSPRRKYAPLSCRCPAPTARRTKNKAAFAVQRTCIWPAALSGIPGGGLKIDTFLFLQTIQTKQRRNYHGNQKVL